MYECISIKPFGFLNKVLVSQPKEISPDVIFVLVCSLFLILRRTLRKFKKIQKIYVYNLLYRQATKQTVLAIYYIKDYTENALQHCKLCYMLASLRLQLCSGVLCVVCLFVLTALISGVL